MSNCTLLKAARKEMKISQAAFAKKVGLNPCTVNKLETDETAWATIQASTLDKILSGLEDKGKYLKEKFPEYTKEKTEEKQNGELVIGPMEAEQILKMLKQPEKTENKDNDKILEMLEFAMDGLRESESDEEFKANLKLMKRILKKY